jgi:osmotically-inducible protein OsmY
MIHQRPDPEIARDAVATLRAELPYSSEHIRTIVRNGWITLEGEVEWNYQRKRAETAVHRVRGVGGVTSSIALEPGVQPSEIKRHIEEAFKRSAEIDAKRVVVEAGGTEVIPQRHRPSRAEREEAERTAWRAPRVTKVANSITMSP